MNIQDCAGTLLSNFTKLYGSGARPRVALAPGRVNLIGEHTDYNGGFVLPMAIDRHTAVVFRPNGLATVRLHSDSRSGPLEFSLNNITKDAERSIKWIDYVRGMAHALQKRGISLRGVDMYISSDLPIGAGLSSSASLEIAAGLAFLDASKISTPLSELAICGQEAEHEFAGVRCGIMDQMVVATAKAGHALLLDCKTLQSINIPIAIEGYSFAIFDTGVRHELASSEYNIRRSECEHACQILGRATLREVCITDLLSHLGALTYLEDRRVRHNLSENVRVIQFASALKQGNVCEAGHLLKASHASLSNDYEVSCIELDNLVSKLTSDPNVSVCSGARMTGGGFGGSVVALIKREKFDSINQSLGKFITTSLLVTPAAGAAVKDL